MLYSIIIVSPFLDSRSLLISSSPAEPYPSLHHVFGMTNHLNSAPFLYLHHRHCHSQDIGLLYPSPSGLSLKIKMSSNTHTPTHLIIHILHLNDTHLNSYTAPSWYSGNRTRASLD